MAAVSAWGQEQKDSLVTLVSAKSAQLIERNGESFRKVTGPARFLHNNTYLLCDSALWNVTTNIIDAVGHVQIIQDRTRLSSGSLQYVVDDDLAKFRGGLGLTSMTKGPANMASSAGCTRTGSAMPPPARTSEAPTGPATSPPTSRSA